MTTWQISIAVPNLMVPRMSPCSGRIGRGVLCGATPTSLYRRHCREETHTEDVWLCPIHATMAVTLMAVCKRCADRGGASYVKLIRLTEPIRPIWR
jgi:hypothetical protein